MKKIAFFMAVLMLLQAAGFCTAFGEEATTPEFTEQVFNLNVGWKFKKPGVSHPLKDALDSVLSKMTADDFNAMMAEATAVQPIGE